MSTNAKRLFLLEREKEGLMKTCAASDETTSHLRQAVSGLSHENAALRERQAELEAQLSSLREVVAGYVGARGEGGEAMADAADAAVARRVVAHEVACQTAADESSAAEEANRIAMDRWQQQLSAMSDWLRTGAALLNGAPANLPPPASLGSERLSGERLSGQSGAAERLSGQSGAAEADGLVDDEPSSVC